jgi:hypothetical protein
MSSKLVGYVFDVLSWAASSWVHLRLIGRREDELRRTERQLAPGLARQLVPE